MKTKNLQQSKLNSQYFKICRIGEYFNELVLRKWSSQTYYLSFITFVYKNVVNFLKIKEYSLKICFSRLYKEANFFKTFNFLLSEI